MVIEPEGNRTMSKTKTNDLPRLPEKQRFPFEIVNHLFPELGEETRQKIALLFDSAFDHPWVDDELRASIAGNICNEHGISIPQEYRGLRDEGEHEES
jgi:hypothetical protein